MYSGFGVTIFPALLRSDLFFSCIAFFRWDALLLIGGGILRVNFFALDRRLGETTEAGMYGQ